MVATHFFPEPPSYPRPVSEALGRMALENGKRRLKYAAKRITQKATRLNDAAAIFFAEFFAFDYDGGSHRPNVLTSERPKVEEKTSKRKSEPVILDALRAPNASHQSELQVSRWSASNSPLSG